MKPIMSSLAAALLFLTVGCAAEPMRSSKSVDTVVGLLVPATSPEARALGVSGWEVRVGAPGLQLTGVDADGHRGGTALFSLRARDGVARSMLVVRLKMGVRGQLAYASDGTVVENTLSDVPLAPRWLAAMHADLAGVSHAGLVPYGLSGGCALGAAETAVSCADMAIEGAACIASDGVIGCPGALRGGIGCAVGIYSTWSCYSAESDTPSSDPSSADPSGADPSASDPTDPGTGSGGWDETGGWDDPGAGADGSTPDDSGSGDSGSGGWDESGGWDDPGTGADASDPTDPSVDSGDWGDTGADGSTDDWGGADADGDGWEDDWGDTGGGGSPDDWGSEDWGSDDTSWDDGSEGPAGDSSGSEGGAGDDYYGV